MSESERVAQKYYTWDGLEPDKWGSVWLLERHIDPKAELSIVPVGAVVKDAIAIDTPESRFKRSHGKATFENMLTAFGYEHDPVLVQIGTIINQLEVSAWSSAGPLVSAVEHQFRQLQYRYNRVDVPVACYAGFFDQLYTSLQQNPEPDPGTLSAQLLPEKVCDMPVASIAARSADPVHIYSTRHILNMIDANKNIVFVDTREDDEYDEHHIPGAINLKLREVNADTVQQFADADLVISYCVKDFRGYEVALALHKAGVHNVGIMKPYGIKGWKAQGLPVVWQDQNNEAEALAELKRCAANGGCGQS